MAILSSDLVEKALHDEGGGGSITRSMFIKGH